MFTAYACQPLSKCKTHQGRNLCFIAYFLLRTQNEHMMVNKRELIKYAHSLPGLAWLLHRLIRKRGKLFSVPWLPGYLWNMRLLHHVKQTFLSKVVQTQNPGSRYNTPITLLFSYWSSYLQEGILSPGQGKCCVEVVTLQWFRFMTLNLLGRGRGTNSPWLPARTTSTENNLK